MEQINNNIKQKKWQQINEKIRYKIEGYFEEGLSCSKIAKLTGYSKRTIERERKLGTVIQRKRNSNFKKYEPEYIEVLEYRADVAQKRHDENASNKGRTLKIGKDHKLAKHIEKKIKEERWSPDAIVGSLKIDGEFATKLCTKTIYNYIDKGIFLNVTNKDLLVKCKQRKRDYKKIRTVALNNKKGKSISERPKEIEKREKIGHWEIDLVIGKQGTKPAILTLVERKTRKSIYILIKNKSQEEVIKALKKAKRKAGGIFKNVFETITADNGSEFLNSEGMKRAGGCKEIYYAHPYCSWERGSNENGNRILRRFIPKGTDISNISEEELQRIEDWVNNYPRKILGYKSANEVAIL